jgi:UDP-GlcNAc:undecaprenyl-phosphate/decaprenyl-phosphate GlcNAc-1-phosphate transferase
VIFPNVSLVGAGTSALVVTFVVTVALVAIAVRVCTRKAWVASPRANRWHKGTPCLFGGVPIWISFVAMAVIFLPFSNSIVWKLVGASSLMFALGVADDIWHLSPRVKLLAQIAIAGWIVHAGLVYPLTQSTIVNVLISLVWIVGITNAFNLLDNMDGLTAGVAVISAIYLAVFFVGSGSREYSILVLLAAGVAAGFLLFNFNPARIFMGDSGSLFLGFLLGGSSLLEVTHVSGVPAFVVAPALVLAIPVFDTFFVSITRRLRGQAVSQGGTDHSSHRLVHMGLSERRAVLLLYGLSIISGAVAVVVRNVFYARAISLMGLWFLFLLLFGIHLFRVETISAENHNHTEHGFLKRILARDSLAFLLDPVVLFLSYYLAYFLRFGRYVPSGDMDLFFRSWPVVIGVKFISLWLCRVYKRSWWRGSTLDLYRLAEATFLGEVAAVIILTGLYHFQGFSRAVFLFDGIFSCLFLLAVRKSFSLFRDSLGNWRNPNKAECQQVFVLGTSEHTESALRFLRDRRIVCAGLIDTNGGADVGRWVWGSQVVGGLSDLAHLGTRHGIREIILPQDESVPYNEIEFQHVCERAHMRLIKLGLYSAEIISHRS